MRKLTSNQSNVISCLTNEFKPLKDICNDYAKIQETKGYSPDGYVWKNEVSTCLNSLIKRGNVEYKYIGLYKIS